MFRNVQFFRIIVPADHSCVHLINYFILNTRSAYLPSKGHLKQCKGFVIIYTLHSIRFPVRGEHRLTQIVHNPLPTNKEQR